MTLKKYTINLRKEEVDRASQKEYPLSNLQHVIDTNEMIED